MSGPGIVPCEGAPRDLGLDQGRACAAEIRDRVARAGARGDWLGRWRPFAGAAAWARAERTARDVRRHFPHQHERLIGLSRGANVSEMALHCLLAGELGLDGASLQLRVGLDGDGRLIVVSSESGILRQAKPDAYFSSVEWTLPWLPGAYAGVNEGGFAGAVASVGSSDETNPGAIAAPAFLLLQNCLHQFDSVEGAAEWCERRPSGGRAQLFFADPTGASVAVSIDGEKRARLESASSAEPAEPAVLDTAPDEGLRIVLDPKARSLEAVIGASRRRLEP